MKEIDLNRFHEIKDNPFNRWFALLELSDLPNRGQERITLGDSSNPVFKGRVIDLPFVKRPKDPSINFAGSPYVTWGLGSGISYEQIIINLREKTFCLSTYARPNITKQNEIPILDGSWHSLHEADILSVGNIDVLINFLPEPQLTNPFNLMSLKKTEERHTGLLTVQDYVKNIQIGNKEYPMWAVNEANEVMEEYGGDLESTIAAVLMLRKAWRNRKKADPSQPGRAFFHNIGGYVVIEPFDNKREK